MRRRPATGRLISAALVLYGAVGVALGDPPSNTITRPPYEQTRQENERGEPPPPPEISASKQAEQSTYTADYQRAYDQLMAKASEELVNLANRQFWDVVEAVLLLGAVGCSAWAALGAGRAVRTAIEANKLNREAFAANQRAAQQELRAYVSIKDAKSVGFSPDTEIGNAAMLIINAGLTPAYGVRYISACGTGFVMPKTKEYKIIGVLDPGQTFVMKVIIPMAQIREHLPLLTSGQRAVFVFGWIEYRDAFNVDRYRSFRYIIDFSDGLRDRNLIMCENGNEAN